MKRSLYCVKLLALGICIYLSTGCAYTKSYGSASEDSKPIEKSHFDKVLDGEASDKKDINYATKEGFHFPISNVDKDCYKLDGMTPGSSLKHCKDY